MAREYFCAYHSFLEILTPYGDAECGRLFRAALIYSATGEEEEFRGNERFIWPTLKAQIDRDKKSYADSCSQNRENGAKGGRPKKPTGFQKNHAVFEETEKTQGEGEGEGKGKDEYKPDSYESGKNTPSSEILTLSLLLKDGTEYEITGEYERRMQTLFPTLNVRKEMQKMSAWCINNPAKRKTKTGITRFINSWLSTAQKEFDEKGGGKSGQGRSSELPPSGSAKRFNVKYDVE